MTLKEYVRRRMLKLVGLMRYDTAADDERLTFINDSEQLKRMKLREYNVWYEGDGDELLNFYTRQNVIDYNYEPFYTRNKKNYFWAISSKEAQIKRTHSGQARNIVDALVNIMPFPDISGGGESGDNKVNQVLKSILRECGLRRMYRDEQLPLTLVEGWGCYKINFDKDFSDNPVVLYYRAENVDFLYQSGRITGAIFRSYYTTDKKKYVLVETRHTERDKVENCKKLVVENELFEVEGENLKPCMFEDVPELAGTEGKLEIIGFNQLFAVPCILLNNSGMQSGYGRSIFTGKIDLFDDLDQALSQASNTVRLSTPIEYFNTEYLERDKNGMPKKPVSYDRKYVMMEGQKNADGVSVGDPIKITQPNIDFNQYDTHAVQILLQILNGILSPATLGIDIAKKDNAAAQREKEKVTIFTRNMLIDGEEEILKELCSQLLCAKELMDTDGITVQHYDISVKFNEFADDSFENKLEVLGKAYDMEEISPELYIEKLYGDTLNRAEKEKELKFLKSSREDRTEAMSGAGGGGANSFGMVNNKFGLNDNEYDEEM
jgi:hypothetical protein